MAAVETNHLTPLPKTEPVWKYQPSKVKFDPEIHLDVEEPEWKKYLSDFGYEDENYGFSKVAATAPFRLFTEEAVKIMRNDLLSEPVQNNHVFASHRGPYTVRGYVPEHSQFMYDAWTHPKVLEVISRAAGTELVPLYDYEIGHANIQLGPKGRLGVAELSSTPLKAGETGEKVETSQYDDKPIDDWHFDYPPFVAVLMASDTTGMVGGETAVQGLDGKIQSVPGPQMGKIVVLQGSRIKHAALRALNCPERIAFVTSFRPKDPTVNYKIRLDTVPPVSDMKILGHQWLSYRLKVLEDRCRIQREKLEAGAKDDVMRQDMIDFAKVNCEWLDSTVTELFSNM